MEISDRFFGKLKISARGRITFPRDAYHLVIALSKGDLIAGYQEHEKAFVFYFPDKFCEIAEQFRAHNPDFQRIFAADHYNVYFGKKGRTNLNHIPKIKDYYEKSAILSWNHKKEKFILKPE